VYPPGSSLSVASGTLFMNRRLLGCAGGGSTRGTAAEAQRIFGLYLAGRLDLDALITHRYPLERVGDAFSAAQRGETARAIVTMPAAVSPERAT
jgi:S-(hydroxymethyl)glutathione dehydrogenase / alcohol dehydrogenase